MARVAATSQPLPHSPLLTVFANNFGRASVVVADMAFLLQGAAPAELPEELFGCVRIEHIVMKDAHKLDLSGAAAPP